MIDLHAIFKGHEDLMELGSMINKKKQRKVQWKHGVVQGATPIGGWYGLKKDFAADLASMLLLC